jgi:hypothetical protein
VHVVGRWRRAGRIPRNVSNASPYENNPLSRISGRRWFHILTADRVPYIGWPTLPTSITSTSANSSVPSCACGAPPKWVGGGAAAAKVDLRAPDNIKSYS